MSKLTDVLQWIDETSYYHDSVPIVDLIQNMEPYQNNVPSIEPLSYSV